MATILEFPRDAALLPQTGRIVQIIARALAGSGVTIEQRQSEHMHGVHQARVRFPGDPNVYRLILAPAEAPLELDGREIDGCFNLPLGDRL